MERAEIFIDEGVVACALLGPNLAEGESEWVTIDEFRARHPGLSQRELEWKAGREAFEKLQARLGKPLTFVYRNPTKRERV